MKKWNLVLDVALCQGCNNCFLACKDEFFENDFPPFSVAQPRHGQKWMNIKRKERGGYPKVDVSYLPVACMQCDNAPCINKAENGAVYKRDDGIVIIDPKKALGKKEIVDTCPYNLIWWNDEKNVPQKCTMCVHLLEEGWEQPRCVQVCPTGALTVVLADDAEMQKIVESKKLEVLSPEFGTSPRFYYRNLYRFTHCFIAGSVALKDTDECAEGAVITLFDSSDKKVSETKANNYGDFKFDGLVENSGKHRLEIEYADYKKGDFKTEITVSVNIGTVFLEK